MGIQLGRNCPGLLKTVNGQSRATNQNRWPDVKKEECKEMTEDEVNQSPRSSVSDGNFSSKEDEMSPDAGGRGLSKFPEYAADVPTSPLKGGSGSSNFDSWDTQSQRKPSRSTYLARNNYALSGAAKRKIAGGVVNIHASDNRQGNKRKRSPSHPTQVAFQMPKLTLPVDVCSSQELSKPVTGFQTPPVFTFNDADGGSTETSLASKDFQLPSPPEAPGRALASTPLSSPLLSPIEIEKDIPDIDFERPLEPQCPMCGASVQQEDLDDFESQHPGMGFRSQQLFCRMHKRRESEDEWKRRSYPDIDWEELPCRLRKYRPEIDEILTKPVVSYFRSEMAKRLRRGKDRNLMMHVQYEGLQNCSVGYYGPRGMKVMTDFILAEFSDVIRKLAGSDKVIAVRGATGYVQMVLAPELATRLVMDDMRQSHPNMKEKEAREILGSSSDLGYLLNSLEDIEQQAITSESQQVVVEGCLEDV